LIALLIGLFFLIYLLTFAGALLGEALFRDVPMRNLKTRRPPSRLHGAPSLEGSSVDFAMAPFVVGEPSKPTN